MLLVRVADWERCELVEGAELGLVGVGDEPAPLSEVVLETRGDVAALTWVLTSVAEPCGDEVDGYDG